jgi:HAD superfamily hydrolase (TIGR01509 family)
VSEGVAADAPQELASGKQRSDRPFAGLSRIETIFFDIGGVLLTNGWDEGQRAAVLPRFGVDLAAYEARHEAANYRWERGLETARWFFDRTVFYEPRKFTFEELWAEVEAQSRVQYPGTYDVLGDLRKSGKYRIATLNNESRELNEYRIKAFELREYFDYFICSGYVREMKPHPDIYRTALEISATPAGQTVFIDDKVENCDAAREMGMQAIHFTSPQQLHSALTEIGVTL